jgi:hypothetical protein
MKLCLSDKLYCFQFEAVIFEMRLINRPQLFRIKNVRLILVVIKKLIKFIRVVQTNTRSITKAIIA